MRERIMQLIKDTLELTNVSDDISQENCDRWDSMRHLHLVIALEMEFGVSFEPEEIMAMLSLSEIEKKIEAKLI